MEIQWKGIKLDKKSVEHCEQLISEAFKPKSDIALFANKDILMKKLANNEELNLLDFGVGQDLLQGKKISIMR